MLSDIPYLTIILTIVIIFIISTIIFRRHIRGPQRCYDVDLSGQVIVITGCSAGIGKETAREIAKRNATVVFACRDEAKTLKIIDQFKEETKNQRLFFMRLDLQNYDSVREFSVAFHKKFDRLNMLINNAGIAYPNVHLDKEGHDLCFKTNHMGHFLLTNLLMDLIIATK